MSAPAIGQPVRRKEDERLLTGKGRFTDDFFLPGQGFASMVRSPHAHAAIRGVDVAAARQMPGVLAVLTGVDCEAEGLGQINHSPLPSTQFDMKLHGPGGADAFIGVHTLLPADKARYVGEALVMVVAETKAQADEAAEAVAIDFEPMPAVTATEAAAAPDAPRVWDQTGGNVFIETFFGDRDATDAAFARADHVIRKSFNIGRVTGVPLEPRSALGAFDPSTGRYTVHAGSGGAVRQKRELAAILNVSPDDVRVLSYDVGGNFGTRNRLYVEFGLVAWAAKKVGRPVKYTAERSEAFLSDYQGRDLISDLELAVAKDGAFLGLRASNLSNVGARCVSLSPLSKGSGIITGSYRIPAAHLRSRAVFSHTPPTNAYRSSGRPEVIFAIERLVEIAAQELGIDSVELRRRNLVTSEEMPYRNAAGMVYDSGDYLKSLDMVMRLTDWGGFDVRKAEAKARGKLLGRGLCHYVESSIGTPVEQSEIHVRGDEQRVDLVIGTQPSGQGHETSFAQVAAEWLGVPTDEVQIVLGDTDVVKVGGGSHSGRSMRMAGTVIVKTADALIAKGKKLASLVMEAAEGDIEFADGRFSIAGTDRSMGLYELASAAAKRNDLSEELQGGLSHTESNEMHTPVFPNGCQLCEVEIDEETGAVQIVRYASVDDVGRAINPLIVDGQTHGAIVQGVGQALWEQCVFDESGQPLCGSFMDYGMPKADHFPDFKTALNEVPSPTNPLGVKAGGEGGTTGAPGVIGNAVMDALRSFGVKDLPMPFTAHKIWRAMRNGAKAG
ncbi:MAG: molybdopterin-dependent oxidoreductase [Alphaproteobacteria bacterium]|nr:molybdopterin-dependent oxidoreductase [Alphaproteobacteria bacterium]